MGNNNNSGKNDANSINAYAMYLLSRYTENILAEDKDNEIVFRDLDNCLCRDVELEKLSRALLLRDKNYVVLSGPTGVGKRNLFYKYVSNSFVDLNVNCTMAFRVKLVEMLVDFGDVTTMMNSFENAVSFITQIADQLSNDARVLIYIEDLDKIPSRLYANISVKLRQLSTDSNIKFILAYNTDNAEISEVKDMGYILEDAELISMNFLSKEDTRKVVLTKIDDIGKFHKCRFSKKIVDYILDVMFKEFGESSVQCILDILDACGAYKEEHKNEVKPGGLITEDIVTKVIYDYIGKDVTKTEKTGELSVKNLNKNLKSNIFGQDRACDIVDKCIKVASVGLNDDNKTVCNLLFVGPTGVGKTELAKVVAKSLDVPMLRYNMTEFQDQISINKLIGSAPGYVGYEEGGRLVSDVIHNPKCVLLLDEIEKAHPSVYNMLLQIMDDAKLTDSLGRTAKFNDVVLIMTSNAGAADIGTRKIGFEVDENKKVIKDEAMDAAIERTFLPEFINRLTEVVKFNFLDAEVGKKIINKKLNELQEKLDKREIKIKLSKSAEEYILERGINNKFGAREISRIFTKEINSILANMIIDNDISSNTNLEVYCKDNSLSVRKKK